MVAAATSLSDDVMAIQKHLGNRLPLPAKPKKRLVGILGDRPSHYSKSPAMWNAVFDRWGLDALYCPFDVDMPKLPALVSVLKSCESVVGFNVTVPYKERVMDFLDGLDADAQRIQAVNTVARTPEGRLIGYNTDGAGFIDSLLTVQPGQEQGFLHSLKDRDVLLLGAGGSARAVAFHVCDQLQGGQLVIANRTLQYARSLSSQLEKSGSKVAAVSEEDIALWAPRVDLIINTTTKGQGGMRILPDGRVTNLEPYSALAPARAPALGQSTGADFAQSGWSSAQADIDANHRASMALAKSIPSHVVFCDLIYHPEETVFLRHAKATGHRTLNGKAMIVCQAVLGFCRTLCRQEVEKRNMEEKDVRKQIAEIMYEAWSRNLKADP